ncbi:toxin-antitoxin system YwqK family antitoxin [Gemmata sp.]|uniref:toxin-antitoxin system YwqK family antitoxin n=1 Tax=Gemmata sp. TaxID=1914242 RepID=UPI003F7055B5
MDYIDAADLDMDDDIRLYQDRPVSGLVRAFHENRALRGEYHYTDGFCEGVCREWFDNGVLRREWLAVRGRVQGEMKEWYNDGSPRICAIYVDGVEIEYRELDLSGNIVLHRSIDRGSEIYKFIASRHANLPRPT